MDRTVTGTPDVSPDFDPPDHAALVAAESDLSIAGVRAVATLIAEGGTVPFIARYRKEATARPRRGGSSYDRAQPAVLPVILVYSLHHGIAKGALSLGVGAMSRTPRLAGTVISTPGFCRIVSRWRIPAADLWVLFERAGVSVASRVGARRRIGPETRIVQYDTQ